MLTWILIAAVGLWLGLGLLALAACVLGGRAEAKARQPGVATERQEGGVGQPPGQEGSGPRWGRHGTRGLITALRAAGRRISLW